MALAGLGAVARGINQGLDLAQRDQDLAEQRAAREEDRAYQRTMRDRQTQEWNKKDALEKTVAGLPQVGSTVTEATDAGPSQRTQTEASYARDLSSAFGKAGDAAKAYEFGERARKLYGEQAARAVTPLLADKSLDLQTLTQRAMGIVDADSSPVGLKDYQFDPKTGKVSLTAYNKGTGYSMPMTFDNVEQARQALFAHYDPETYKARQKAIQDTQLEIEKAKEIEGAKSKYTVVGPGAVALDNKTGKPVLENSNGLVPVINPDGTISHVRPGAGSSGSGSGAGGKAPKEFSDQAAEIIKDSIGKADGSPEFMQRYTRAMSFIDGIYGANPGIQPRTAAAIAADAINNPGRISAQVDLRTGKIGQVYKNPDFDSGRQYNLAPGSVTVPEMEKRVGKRGMVEAATQMLDGLTAQLPDDQRASAKNQLIQIASDPKAKSEYLRAAKEAGKDVQALSRQLDLVGMYLQPPKPDAKLDARSSLEFRGMRPSEATYVDPMGNVVP